MIVKFSAKMGLFTYTEWDLKLPQEQSPVAPQTLTKREQTQLINYCKENISYKNIGILITLATGLRIGECCALKWQDIDIPNGYVSVTKTLTKINNTVREQTPKTKTSTRLIPLPREIIQILRPLVKYNKGNNYIINNLPKPPEPRIIRQHFYKVLRQIGLKKIKYHGLRHTFATRCINSGCNYKAVSEMLGHSNVNITLNLYVHPDMEEKRKDIEKAYLTVAK